MNTMRWTVTMGLACAALLGCQKSSDSGKQQAEKAAAEADQKTVQAANDADQRAREARAKADRERDDLHVTVAREKEELRTKISDALDRLNKDLIDMKIDLRQVTRGDRSHDKDLYAKLPPKDQDKIGSMLLRRDRLMDDADQIDPAIDHDWPALEDRIKTDLEKGKAPLKPGRT